MTCFRVKQSLKMETLANLESFVRSAESGSFSAAARRLSLTPAAVSRNVATLERNLGVRLFQRSTRRLTLTEAGERFLAGIDGSLDRLQEAIADAAAGSDAPAGVLKISMAPTFGRLHVLPVLPGFLARYPLVRPEWHFEDRRVDLIAEGFDAAIGAGFELSAGVVSRRLAPAHVVAVAAPAYLAGRPAPTDPDELAALDGIVLRSVRSGRIMHWSLQDAAGNEKPAALAERIVVNEPAAMREATLLGLGVALMATADILPELDSGALVRLVSGWYADAGAISLYYPTRTLLPAKTRAFIDHLTEAFRRTGLADRLAATDG